MGVSDRDWYQRGRPPNYSRSAASRQVGRLLGTFVRYLVVFMAGIYAHQWWETRHPSSLNRAEPTRLDLSSREERPLHIPKPQVHREINTAVVEAPPTYNCIVNSRVIYSGPEDCRGRMPSARTDTPAVAAPAGFTEYQREMLRSADARIARDHAAAQRQLAAQAEASKSSSFECSSLSERIAHLDARARQPLSGYEQDAIRTERQRARSRQSELRC